MHYLRIFATCTVSTPIIAAAFVPCATPDQSSGALTAQAQSVAREAGIGTKRSIVDVAKVISGYCNGQPAVVDDLIDSGRISAKEASAVRKVLIPSKAGAGASPTSNGVEVKAPSQDEAASLANAVNVVFSRWSSGWMFDRYIDQSAVIQEIANQPYGYLARGVFRFTRGGQVIQIPFASAVVKTAAGDFISKKLCYNDPTSGMTDCTQQGEISASNMMFRTVIMGGLVAALNSNSGPSTSSSTDNSANLADQLQREEHQRQVHENTEAYKRGEPMPHFGVGTE